MITTNSGQQDQRKKEELIAELTSKLTSLREQYRQEEDPTKKELLRRAGLETRKEIAAVRHNNRVCYWEYCCEPWAKDIDGFCSQEHKDLHWKEFPLPKQQSLFADGRQLKEAVQALRNGTLNINTLREQPRTVETWNDFKETFPSGVVGKL